MTVWPWFISRSTIWLPITPNPIYPRFAISLQNHRRQDRRRYALLHPNRFDVRELADAVHTAQLTPVPGPFYAAEGHARIRHHHLVDEHHPGIDLIGEAVALGGVVGPCAGAQSEAAVVCEADGFV